MEELRRLEQDLAYEAARSDIECYCPSVQCPKPHTGRWWDTASIDPEYLEYVKKALRYLDLAKMIVHHPKHGHLVRFT